MPESKLIKSKLPAVEPQESELPDRPESMPHKSGLIELLQLFL
jgi:hypothetical protein